MRRWLRKPGFRAAYQLARRQVTEQATALLQKLCTTAALALGEIIEDKDAPASARVMACRTIIEMAQKGVEVDELTSRVEALERGRQAEDKA